MQFPARQGRRFSESDAQDLVLRQVHVVPAVKYLLMHHVPPALIANKGANQPGVDLVRALYSRLITSVAQSANTKIENFRHTKLAIQVGGPRELLNICQQEDHTFFSSTASD
jgi:hypothetical protein